MNKSNKTVVLFLLLLFLIAVVASSIAYATHNQKEKLVEQIEGDLATNLYGIQDDIRILTNVSEFTMDTNNNLSELSTKISLILQSIALSLSDKELSSEERNVLSSMQTTFLYLEHLVSSSWNLLFGQGESFRTTYCDKKLEITNANELINELFKFKEIGSTVKRIEGTGNEIYQKIITGWDAELAYKKLSCH